MENLYRQAKDEAEKMQRTRQGLVNDIQALKYKIAILDNTAFSIEQDFKRKYQEIRELNDKKDRTEKLIANILNGEGYSKLKHVIKENVQAALSDNKKLILLSFAALIQTLINNPEMAKLIYNIPIMNNGQQHKDNDKNNIMKYLQSNKDGFLDLSEKHYETLIEALTNNAIFTATASSDAILSLPQSSSTFELI